MPTAVPPGSPPPTIPAVGLVILEPQNGRATTDRVVVVHGLAAPGSVITRDIPLWFDDHVIADSAGRWSFALNLNIGENVFTFRVGDDVSTTQTLTVHCFAI